MNKFLAFAVTTSLAFLAGCTTYSVVESDYGTTDEEGYYEVQSYETYEIQSTNQTVTPSIPAERHKINAASQWDALAEYVASRIKERIDIEFPIDLNTLQPPVLITSGTHRDKTAFGRAFQHLLRAQLIRHGVNVVTSAHFVNTMILDYDMQVIRHKDGDPLMPGETDTEVVINTSLTKGPQFLFSHSGIYYINSRDYDHYVNDSRNFQVVGCPQDSTCQ